MSTSTVDRLTERAADALTLWRAWSERMFELDAAGARRVRHALAAYSSRVYYRSRAERCSRGHDDCSLVASGPCRMECAAALRELATNR